MTDTSPERVAEVSEWLRAYRHDLNGAAAIRQADDAAELGSEAADLLSALAAERNALAERHAKALHLAEYIDHRMNGLDDFGDFAAIPSQPWVELFDLLRDAALNETGDTDHGR